MKNQDSCVESHSHSLQEDSNSWSAYASEHISLNIETNRNVQLQEDVQ